MGRKKKKETASMETKNSIVYSGHVSISYKKNEPGKPRVSLKRHNAGCVTLFSFIAQALGGYTNASLRPAAIQIYNNDAKFLAYPIAYLSKPKIGDDSVTFVFTIPGRSLIMPPSETSPINKLELLSNVGNQACAIIELTGDDVIKSVDPSESLLIQWQLTFENKQA